MSPLRDPLLLTLLASSLAHGTAFLLQPATTAAPTATVRAGRTAVRLQPSLAAPPPPLLEQSVTQPTPPDTVPVDQEIPSPENVLSASSSPPRQTPRIAPPSRPNPPQLTSSSITPVIGRPIRSKRTPLHRVAPPPTAPSPRQDNTFSAVRTPNSPRISTPPGQLVTTLPRPTPTTQDHFRPSSSPHSPAPVETASLAPRAPRPRPTERPRPKKAAPAPSLDQPASRQDFGGPRTLPTAVPDNPLPVYPAAAAKRRRQGTVIISMAINANGRVAAASVHRSSGHSDLDAAAIDAARQWTFRPAQRAGTAVAITVLKPFRFVLESR